VGDRDAALVAFFRGVLNMPEHELELLRSLPSWEARKAFAHTISRELRAAEGYRFVPDRFAAMRPPTLLLMGSESPAFLTDATAAVHATLPDSRLGVMAGQQHIAMTAAPDLFLGTLLPFLTAD